MPYSRPLLTDINTSVLQDIQAAGLPGVDGLLQRAVLRVLAMSMAGLAQEHYGYQDWIALQSVPFTATGENLYGWGNLKGVQLKAATSTVLQASFTGTAGTDLPSGTGANTGNSLAFTTNADAVVAAAGTVTATLTAAGTGTAYNLAVGTTLTLTNAIAGINSSGTVTAIVTSAADQETDDEFRTRMLQVYASPPQGGAASDYVTWAEAVPGVTRAWCNPNGYGVGTVVVYTMWDDVEAASGGFPQGTNGVAATETRDTPATGDQLAVANAIYPLRPVTALVYSCAPTPDPISFVIADVDPLSSTTQAAITAALADLFVRIGTPLGMTVYPSDWNEAIASVSGMEHFYVSSPTAPVVIPLGQLPTVGTVTATA